MTLSLESALAQAILLRDQKDFPAAESAFTTLLAQYPHNARVQYHYAWLCDKQGEEHRAVPHYEQALKGDLSPEERRGALLGLGSTYRTLGRYAEAETTLRKGMTEFTDAREFAVFHAMALYNLGAHHDAMQCLLRLLADTTTDEGIQRFARAIRFYAENLDQTW